MESIGYIILGFCFIVFLYFGYRDDFRRDKKRFINTILGVFGLGIMHLIFVQIDIDIPLWISLSILIFFILMNVIFPNSKNDKEKSIKNSGK